MTEYFTYFAYGSNMLKRRIRICNPSARFINAGRLDGYRLDFQRFSRNWNGASATIIETDKKSDVVWGAIWTIHIHDLPALDKTKVYWDIPHLYFSYGSNMLTERIILHTPSAEFISIGRIENNRLHFGKYSKAWGGPTATMVPTANAHIWGVIYKLNKVDLLLLDKRKRSDKDKYFSRAMKVQTPHKGMMSCRVFILNDNPLPRGDNDPIPVEQWPSKTYKQVLIDGAREHGLPQFYIDFLKSLRDNGQIGFLKMARYLNLYRDRPPCKCKIGIYHYYCY